jgi:uncharacterized membrane protein YsdA (DUF1294 family)
MSSERYLLIIYLVLINVMSLFMFAIDKLKAKKRKWRISEFALLVSAGLGGALGAFISMKLFRHKTKHPKFRVLVPLFLVLWTALCVWLIVFVKI